jgi:hypothetical protein
LIVLLMLLVVLPVNMTGNVEFRYSIHRSRLAGKCVRLAAIHNRAINVAIHAGGLPAALG